MNNAQLKITTTPLYLITGFLGSGKTTFVQRAIDYFKGKQRIAIVQNEFAQANFDGKELKRTTSAEFDLLEINNGSVFCVCLLSGFIESLKAFTNKYQPDIILMEASGLSDPISIGQIFNSPALQDILYLAGTICIVDAQNFNKFDKLLPRIHHQIQIADIILLNKSDLTGNFEKLNQKISKLNPFAKRFNTTYCDVPVAEIFSTAANNQKKMFFIPDSSDRPDIKSLVFRSAKPLKAENVKFFLNEITSKTIRLKGYILLDNTTTLTVQATGNELSTETIYAIAKQTEIIAIGYDINMPNIKALYNSCT